MSEQGRTKGQSTWTDDRRATVAKLWKDGLTGGQIAKKVGGCSRNAVIGLVYRMGLSNRPAAAKPTRIPARPKSVAPSRLHPQAKVFGETKVPLAKPKLAVAGNGAVFEQAPVTSYTPNASTWAPLPGCEPITLTQLSDAHCKWPVDLSGMTEQMFCGCRSVSRWCLAHEEAERERSRKQHPKAAKNEAGLLRMAKRLAA